MLSAAAADFNEDSNFDFAQAISYHISDNPWKDGVAIDLMIGDGTGHFTLGTSLPFRARAASSPQTSTADGHADIVVLDQTASGTVRKVFLGHGNGTFVESDQSTTPGDYMIGTGDINGDGKVDLFVWNYASQTVSVYLGSGTGTFPTEKTTSTAGGLYGAHVADLNSDGRSDVVASRSGTTLVAWLGGSDGSFSGPIDQRSTGERLQSRHRRPDWRRPPDVLTAEGTLAVGKGDGTFSMNRQLNIGFYEALAVDIDRDGRVDLYLGRDYTAMALYNLDRRAGEYRAGREGLAPRPHAELRR